MVIASNTNSVIQLCQELELRQEYLQDLLTHGVKRKKIVKLINRELAAIRIVLLGLSEVVCGD